MIHQIQHSHLLLVQRAYLLICAFINEHSVVLLIIKFENFLGTLMDLLVNLVFYIGQHVFDLLTVILGQFRFLFYFYFALGALVVLRI